MNKNFIYLIWSDCGVAGIAENNIESLTDTLKKCLDKSNYPYDDKMIEEFIKNKKHTFGKCTNWFIELHPINELYNNGVNI